MEPGYRRRFGRLARVTSWSSTPTRIRTRSSACGGIPKVRIAACGVRGALKGPWHGGIARLIENGPEQKVFVDALLRKYGWQMRLADLSGRIGGTKKNWAFIAIEVSED